MHQSIQELLELTAQCAERIEALDYEKLQGYLVKREQVLSQVIYAKLSENEKTVLQPLIQKILSYDGILLNKMKQMKSEIGTEISKMGTAKKQKNAYGTKCGLDSVYFDKKR